MSTAEQGCKHCGADHWGLDGTRKCRFEPMRFDTPLRRSIAAWLQRVGAAEFTAAGCPGFWHWKEPPR